MNSLKFKFVLGSICIFMGLGFGLYYQLFTVLEPVYSLGSIALGFACGDFIYIMVIIQYLENKFKEDLINAENVKMS